MESRIDVSQWNLTTLHEEKIEKLKDTQEILMNYLMDCQTFLKERDLHGWIKTFAPDLLTPKTEEPTRKRRRMAPSTVIFQELPACTHCGSKEVIEDVREGTVVCTTCGIIQGQLLKADASNVTYDRLKNGNRDVVHRYSRVVYFRSFLLKIRGETNPCLQPKENTALHQFFDGKDKDKITPTTILAGLKQLNLLRLRRHAISLAVTFSNNKFKAITMSAKTQQVLLTLFRRIEFFWELGGKRILENRKVFFSYPYIFYQLCYHLKKNELCKDEYLLQSSSRLLLLHKAYGRIAKKANITCNLKATRKYSSK